MCYEIYEQIQPMMLRLGMSALNLMRATYSLRKAKSDSLYVPCRTLEEPVLTTLFIGFLGSLLNSEQNLKLSHIKRLMAKLHHILKVSQFCVSQQKPLFPDCRLTCGSLSLEKWNKRRNLQLSGPSLVEPAATLGLGSRHSLYF